MELLKYENLDVPETSYSGQIKNLIQRIRYYKAERSNEDLKAAMPELLQVDHSLKQIAKESGETKHEFVEEIMDALMQEKEQEEKLAKEINKSGQTIIERLFNENFLLQDFSYKLRCTSNTAWVEFYGCKQNAPSNSSVLVVKEIFRAACYKFGIVFIDVA